VEYLITFLEGFITFISPCLLPMLPIYFAYFSGRKTNNQKTAVRNAMGFIVGFTIIFVILGAFAGTIGSLLRELGTAVNIISGVIMIMFGLNFMEIIRLPLLNTNWQPQIKFGEADFFSSLLFGMVFAVAWTPCVGAFLGSALLLAASGAESLKGIFLLLCFSLGLGLPFLVSAVLIESLKSAFAFLKNNYRIVNLFSGGLLVVVGIMMATGVMGYFLALFSFRN
jgi:cytochrome c-type biogenesis protein